MPNKSQDWTRFTPPKIPISHPWISRFYPSSALLQCSSQAEEQISTLHQEIYGSPPSTPISFSIGNGGAGYTGLLKALSEAFISENGNDFRIGWISNHSRHSQIALLADVVQVALTYEPENEALAEKEGWCRKVSKGGLLPVFWDHFILVGPRDKYKEMGGRGLEGVLSSIKKEKWSWHSRGDGSATYVKEGRLWRSVGVKDLKRESWVEVLPGTPYVALVRAERDGAFLITDRATFLTAKRDEVIPNMRCFVEGGEKLLNPCSAMVWDYGYRGAGERRSENMMAARFAEWLGGEVAQGVVREFGRDWSGGKPLFTEAIKEEFDIEDRLDFDEQSVSAKL
ncbi:Tungstate-binding protein TupA [Pseudocercospora fuligena]|uniref:Tungstate-binding protein TupA n=1 Tax=Pseudocercospora fuligena TaxID=685502 RepID=A0A8H6REC3_9PEZI|nr:Tungstate-binding protein TupA [Pseudocercospora fuligena]